MAFGSGVFALPLAVDNPKPDHDREPWRLPTPPHGLWAILFEKPRGFAVLLLLSWVLLWGRVFACRGGCESLPVGWFTMSPDWLWRVNRAQSPAERVCLGRCIAQGRPYGSEAFETGTAERLGLEAAFRERGQAAKEARKV